MKLQTILNRLQKLHPKEIDLSLDRVKNLCKKLGDPQKTLKYISFDKFVYGFWRISKWT